MDLEFFNDKLFLLYCQWTKKLVIFKSLKHSFVFIRNFLMLKVMRETILYVWKWISCPEKYFQGKASTNYSLTPLIIVKPTITSNHNKCILVLWVHRVFYGKNPLTFRGVPAGMPDFSQCGIPLNRYDKSIHVHYYSKKVSFPVLSH